MLKRTHLRQFLATVETGRFTAAARRLNITQPTLSAGISQLERLVGARGGDGHGAAVKPAGNANSFRA